MELIDSSSKEAHSKIGERNLALGVGDKSALRLEVCR